ncbi:MAG: hypothetical protein QG622_3445, partial [Actinomycetota bacterium]|nr:hypothetical protein [Actinomycetota bacterium]
MPARIRPNRLDVTDRFPMLGATILSDGPGRGDGPACVAEVVIATDPELFTAKDRRTPSNFYSSREHGLLSVPGGEAVYLLRPDVLARFIGARRLYLGLATATSAAGTDWRVDVLPTAQSPYVSIAGLSDRALRRVRMYPMRGGSSYGTAGPRSTLEWAGDHARPGTLPAAPAPQPVVQPAPQPAGAPSTMFPAPVPGPA